MHDNVALISPGGVGKSWLACTIGQKACRDNRSVMYYCWPRLYEKFALTRGERRYARILKSLGCAELLILDEFCLEPLDANACHDLLKILGEGYSRPSTIFIS